MQYVRIRVKFPPAARPPVQAALCDCPSFERGTVHFGGISTTGPRTHVLSVRGDPAALTSALADREGVIESELVHADGHRGVVYVLAEGTETELALQATLSRDSLVSMPPIEFGPDGSVTFRVVGEGGDLQRAVEEVRDRFPVTVERLGEYDSPPERVGAGLTARQAELVGTALDLGYYDVPRTATHEDVADAAGCAPSTASEHLRKAEAALVRANFE